MIGIGIIGCGSISRFRHLPEYEANPQVRIAGLYDFNHDRALELAKRYSAIAYDSIDELLARNDVGAVSVCTSNSTHASIAIAALKAGKHVLCEKPMAVSIEDCELMVAAARSSGLKLMIDQNQRLTPAHLRAKRLIEEGAIGRILTFRSTFGHAGPETWSADPGHDSWFFDPTRAGMGAMADLGVHKTDLIQWLVGQRVVSTSAKLETLDKRTSSGELVAVDDNAVCIYELDGGIIGTMTASWTYYGKEDNSTVLYGTEGIMRIYDNPAFAIEIDAKHGERTLIDVGSIQTNDTQTASGVIDAFIAAIVADEEPPISGESVLSAMRAVFASITSSESGTTIHVKQR